MNRKFSSRRKYKRFGENSTYFTERHKSVFVSIKTNDFALQITFLILSLNLHNLTYFRIRWTLGKNNIPEYF